MTICMSHEAFEFLAHKLINEGQYVTTRGVTVDEALGMFIKVVGHVTTH